MRRLAVFLSIALGLALGAEVDLDITYPSYLFIATSVTEVIFDFTASSAPRPGYLSELDPILVGSYPKYANYIMPAATKEAFEECLEIPSIPSGSYQGQPNASSPTKHCRFAPTDHVNSGLVQVHYLGTGRQHCRDPLYADADLLVLANNGWKVQAHLLSPPPPGVELHVLPLTYKAPDKRLCKYGAIDNPKRHDRTLSTTKKRTISKDPQASNKRYAYYSQHRGVFAIPLLFYLDLDPSLLSVDAGSTQTITVEYILSQRP